ncbi:twin-arginine translocase subunit TatC [Methylophilus methylotrophus]|uniref:twin-arginine translocase subunit TatC n=1 Tax=Methylophilus methylotrophus TaxID=17 RepID=UPI000363F4AE|nr:twin-arginine translocase subunit TatC [Methylophilus methylotrophus]
MEYNDTLSHFYELRTRCIRILAGLLLAALVTLPFANQLHQFFVSPLLSQLPASGKMIATSVTSPFFIPLKIALYMAFVLSLPNTLYQLWKFIQPGLYPKEKLVGVIGVLASLSLFILGASFAFYVVIPVVFKFIIGSAPVGVAVMTEIGNYLDFLISITLAFGVAFQTPIIVVAISCMGMVELKTLKESRGYVIVGAFVIGAIFTPPDIISQFMLAIPLWFLYELGLLVASVFFHKRNPTETASLTAS